jgi:hypothetical protein
VLELWITLNGSTTGTPFWTVGYIDGAGNAQTTTVQGSTNPTGGAAFRMPLITSGIQGITSVVESGGPTVLSFNVSVMRRLVRVGLPFGANFVGSPNTSNLDHPMLTGMPLVYDTSALVMHALNTSGARSNEVLIEITEA